MWRAATKLLAHLQRAAAAGISREQVDALAGLAGAEAQRQVRRGRCSWGLGPACLDLVPGACLQ